jgi:hypothetical protein
MKVVKSYTDREIRIILEAIVEDTVRSHGLEKILKESDERNQVEITERGRETIKATLYAIASIITIDLPVVGWILGPLLYFFTFTGTAPDAVINLLEGKMGVDRFITTAENAAIKITNSAKIPLIGQVLPDLDQLTALVDPDKKSKNRRGADTRLSVLLYKKEGVLGNQAAMDAITAHIRDLQSRSGGKLTVSQAASVIYAVDLLLDLLTAAYLTRGKTVKKTKGRKKRDFKIPGGKEGFVSFGALPSPYSYLKGIAPNDPVENSIYNQVIEDEGIIDVEPEVISRDDGDPNVRVASIPGRPALTDNRPDQLRLDRPDDFDIDPEDLEEARYVKNLREQIEVIKIINRVLR